jgi:hypothetical protein
MDRREGYPDQRLKSLIIRLGLTTHGDGVCAENRACI